MAYRLGVDLGTTWTAAATWRDDRATIVSLGQRRAAIPSVAVLRESGEFLVGDAAARRAVAEPERVAREFKRRIGDTTPLIVGGMPQTPESLTARLLRFVVDEVATLEGGPPDELAVAHPANWGTFKIDLIRQILGEAGQDPARCLLITEPEAAAITYATEQRVPAGQRVCVYDLGGGTFDTTVVERTPSGFRILGRPQGIERLGGVDFDAAVFAYVTERLGDALAELDPADPTTLSALARLRLDCTDAKEALSADVSATVPVFLPSVQTEIRITRSEFEGLIRPVLADTIETTRRAIASAELETSDIDRVLLVGGSSRIPIVSQLVQNELDIDTAIDSHPKHAIALGTAIHHLTADPAAGPSATIVTDQPSRPQPDSSPSPSPSPAPGPGPGAATPPAAVAINDELDPDDMDRAQRAAPPPQPSSRPAGPQPGSGPAPQPGGQPARPPAAAPAPAAAAPSPAPAPAPGPGPGPAQQQRPRPAPPPGAHPATPDTVVRPRGAGPPPGPATPAVPPAGSPPGARPEQPPAGPRPGTPAPSSGPATPPPAGVRPAPAQPAVIPPGVTPPPTGQPAKARQANRGPSSPPGSGGNRPPVPPSSPPPGFDPRPAGRPPQPPGADPGRGGPPPAGLGPILQAGSPLPAQPRSGSTELQPPSDRGRSTGGGRSSVTIWLVVIFIALMVGFGVFLLLRPPSDLLGLDEVPSTDVPAIHANRTYVRLTYGNTP